MSLKSTILLLALLALVISKSFADGSLNPAHIHWSTPATLLSPEGRWMLHVKPSDADDEDADVYISRTGNQAQSQLFKLQRDAEVYWRADQDQMVVLDEKSSDEYRLLIFDLKKPSEHAALKLNGEIAQDIKEHLMSGDQEHLMSGDQITYYFPRVSTWIGKADILTTVGAVTVHNGAGPFTAHCFGYIADVGSQQIKSRLNANELKEKYGTSCQIWP